MAYVYPAASVGDRYLVTLKGDIANQTILSTFYYSLVEFTGSPTKGAVMDDLRSALSAGGGVESTFLDCCPENYFLRQMWIQPVWILRYARKTYTVNTDGNWPSEAQTANVSAVITRRGVNGTRKGVGSLHVPISTQNDAIANGNVTAGLKAALGDLATAMAAQLTGAAGYKFNPIIPRGSDPLDVTVIQTCFPQTSVRVMRRRTVGLGI